MTKIDERVNDVVSAHKVSGFAVKANRQSTKLVNPSRSTLAGKAQFVDIGVEPAFTSAFGALAGAGVFDDVGNKLMVEAGAAGGLGVKGGIGIEVTARDSDAQALDEFERPPVSCLSVQRRRYGCQNEPVGVGDRQDIRGLGFLPSLISHRLTACLGGRVAAVEVEVMGVNLLSDIGDAVFKDPLQAAIAAPLAIVVVDGLIADFFFCGSSGSGSMGRRAH